MPKKNAYFLFMVHFKNDQEARNGQKLGMAEVSEQAASAWNELSEEMREYWRARARNGNESDGIIERKSSQGIPFSVVDRSQTDKVNLETEMMDRIYDLLNHFSVPVGICSYPIFIMSANYFYRRKEKFVPAEIALVKFTFRKGIQERYHAFLNPGSIDLGYAADAKNHSEDTHKLPIPPHALGERHFHAAFHNIWKVLTKVSASKRFDDGKPFVFTYANDYTSEEDNVFMLKSVLSQLSNQEAPIDVYPLSRLFFVLATNLFEIDRFQKVENISIVNMLLSRDSYDHTSGFSCEYHERVDACTHCALSKATRWAYLLAKHLCEPLAINLIRGKHMPLDVKGSHYQSMQSLEESTGEESTDDYESRSERSFGNVSSSSACTYSSGASRRSRLQHMLEQQAEKSADISDTTSCTTDNDGSIAKNVRRDRKKDDAMSFKDILSSIGSASTFDDEDSVKSGHISDRSFENGSNVSYSSSISRRSLLHNLLNQCANESTTEPMDKILENKQSTSKAERENDDTLDDGLSSVHSASIFDGEESAKFSHSTQNVRRRYNQFMKDDEASSVGDF